MTEENITFEQAFSRLEEVVRALEGGETTLEKSLQLFEEGVKLARLCSVRLDTAEGRMRKLIESEGGEVVEEMLDEFPGAVSS